MVISTTDTDFGHETNYSVIISDMMAISGCEFQYEPQSQNCQIMNLRQIEVGFLPIPERAPKSVPKTALLGTLSAMPKVRFCALC